MLQHGSFLFLFSYLSNTIFEIQGMMLLNVKKIWILLNPSVNGTKLEYRLHYLFSEACSMVNEAINTRKSSFQSIYIIYIKCPSEQNSYIYILQLKCICLPEKKNINMGIPWEGHNHGTRPSQGTEEVRMTRKDFTEQHSYETRRGKTVNFSSTSSVILCWTNARYDILKTCASIRTVHSALLHVDPRIKGN